MSNYGIKDKTYAVHRLCAHMLLSASLNHVAHFSATERATHDALGEYYEGITNLADTLAEAYMGYTGEKQDMSNALCRVFSVGVSKLTAYQSQRYVHKLATELQLQEFDAGVLSVLQEICLFVDSIQYKLTLT